MKLSKVIPYILSYLENGRGVEAMNEVDLFLEENPNCKNIYEICYKLNLSLEAVKKQLSEVGIKIDTYYLNQEDIGSRLCTKLITTIHDIKKLYKDNNRLISECDQENTDFCHIPELKIYSNEQKISFFDTFKECRIKRRKVKNRGRILKPLIDYLNEEDDFAQGLNQVASKLHQEKENVSKQQYMPRVRSDLF